MGRSMDYDGLALEIMLSSAPKEERKQQLAALAKQANCALGLECPECGDTEVEDNGCSGASLTNLCTNCGHQWGPGTEV